MKLKNKIIIGVSAAVACVLPFTGAFKAYAASHKMQPLVVGINLSLSNSVTITNNQSNLFYLAQVNNGIYSNVLSLTTNSAGTLVPNVFQAASLFSDSLGNPGSNVAFWVVMNNSNIVNYPGLADNDNTIYTNVVTNGLVLTANATNVITFTLARIMAGGFIDTYTNSMLNITFTNTGLSPILASTNLPLSFITGAKGVIIYQIVVGGSTGNGCILSYAGIGGWIP